MKFVRFSEIYLHTDKVVPNGVTINSGATFDLRRHPS
jgi:hypothetical protein